MKAHMTRPCENCPYRVDAPRRHWARDEFRGVLQSELSELGTVYSCHKQKDLPAAERGFCAGWALDQKRRNLPSIKLRLLLIHDREAADAFKVLDDGGLTLFGTVKQMCRANGVRP